MRIGGLEKILRKSVMVAVGSSLAFSLLIGCGKEKSPTEPVNQAPETHIINGPSGVINENTASFEWGGSDDGNVEKYMYRFSPVMDTYAETYNVIKTFSDLTDGNYAFYVKAIDNEGKEDPTPAERSFTVVIPDTLILQDCIDAYVRGVWEDGEPKSDCDENYGSLSNMYVSYWKDVDGEGGVWEGIDRIYIKFYDYLFNLLPYNANIKTAKLILSDYYPPSHNVVDIQASRVENEWSDWDINWNNQPDFSDNIEVMGNILEGNDGYEWNIPNLVEDWANDYYPNHGLVLKILSEEGEYRGCIFRSNNYSEDPSKRPKIEVIYTLD